MSITISMSMSILNVGQSADIYIIHNTSHRLPETGPIGRPTSHISINGCLPENPNILTNIQISYI